MAITHDQQRELKRLAEAVQTQTVESERQSMRLREAVHAFHKYTHELTDYTIKPEAADDHQL